MKLKDILELIENEDFYRQLEEESGIKKGIKAALTAGFLTGASIVGLNSVMNKSVTPVQQKAIDDVDKFDKQNQQKAADMPHILTALKHVESAGGSLQNHVWLEKGVNKGERAIGPYAFLPSTIKDLISKTPSLKSKYSDILSMNSGNFNQDEIEEFMANHPSIHDDLAKTYVNQIIKLTPAKTAGEISRAWLLGPTGYVKYLEAGKGKTVTKRYQDAEDAFAKSKQANSLK